MSSTCRNKPKRRLAPRIRGVVAAAEALGVCHDHLRLVLRGKRPGNALRKRYQDYVKAREGGLLPLSLESRAKQSGVSLGAICAATRLPASSVRVALARADSPTKQVLQSILLTI